MGTYCDSYCLSIGLLEVQFKKIVLRGLMVENSGYFTECQRCHIIVLFLGLNGFMSLELLLRVPRILDLEDLFDEEVDLTLFEFVREYKLKGKFIGV